MRGWASGATRSDYLRIFGEGATAGLDESGLLARFAERGDEAAFEALVARLGPTVLGVCRRTLGAGPDADDAFQATFLVLVRRAGSIRGDEPLGPWLHGVALKVSRRARQQAARRLARERSRGVVAEGREDDRAVDRSELRAQIDEEIARLPEHHRRAVLLCDVEGLSREEAAARLGWTANMVRGRLDRARARLRERLSRRGLAPSDSWVILIGPPAAPKPLLVAMTVRTAAGYALGRGLFQGPAVALCEGVIRMTMLAQWKLAATALLSACAVAGTSGIFAAQDPGGVPVPGPGLGLGADPAQVPAGVTKPELPAPGAKTAPDDPIARGEGPLRSSAAIGRSRVEAARQRLEAQQAFYQEGRITIDRLIDASRVMMEAERDVAETPEAREVPLRVHLARLRVIKARELAELQVGRATTADVAEAESNLLDAEFLLAREVEARARPRRADAPPPADPLAPANPPAAAPKADARPESARDLARERVELARRIKEVTEGQFKGGGVGFDALLAASKALLEAELDAAESRAARLDILAAMIRNGQEIVQHTAASAARGDVTSIAVDQARAAVLEARYQLAKEAEGPGPGPGPIPRPDGPPSAASQVSAASANPPAAAPKADARPESARNLARERVKLAREVKEISQQQYQVGRVEFEAVLRASKALMEAELDAADSKAARLDILAALVRGQEDVARIVTALVESARKSPRELAEARAAVLEARYRLAKDSETPDSDPERRMSAVEGKLDRIIEQLGAKGPK